MIAVNFGMPPADCRANQGTYQGADACTAADNGRLNARKIASALIVQPRSECSACGRTSARSYTGPDQRIAGPVGTPPHTRDIDAWNGG